MHQQFVLQKSCNFHHRIIILAWRFAELYRVNGNTRINIVMKCQHMIFERKVPGKRIKIVFFPGKFNLEVIGKNVRNLVKSFQAAIVVNNCFCAAEVGT